MHDLAQHLISAGQDPDDLSDLSDLSYVCVRFQALLRFIFFFLGNATKFGLRNRAQREALH